MALTIEIPSSNNSSGNFTVAIERTLVLIGANGSGKSRLGAWLEDKYGEQAVRVTAQKSLEIPDSFTISSASSAYAKHRFGHEFSNVFNRINHFLR